MFPVFINLGLIAVMAFFLMMISTFSVSLYLHRSLAHRSVVFVPWFEHMLRFLLWLTTGMLRREWVAVHRKHHPFADKEGDPHSPIYKGVWHTIFFGVWMYRKEAAKKETLEIYAHDIFTDRIESALYERFSFAGILFVMPIIDFLLFGWLAGFFIWLIQVIWIPVLAAGLVNGIGHSLGHKGFGFLIYRNHDTRDNSVNLRAWIFSLLTGGETNHNCHHAHPASARIKCRRWEVDPGWWVISILAFAGIAREIKIAVCEYNS